MKDNVVKDKSLEFAVRIVNLYKFLVNEQKEFVMSKQILRSGTSIGANIREAEQAQSRADFINKLNIALKEANETEYWLELLIRTEYITREQYESINNDSTEDVYKRQMRYAPVPVCRPTQICRKVNSANVSATKDASNWLSKIIVSSMYAAGNYMTM